MTRRLVWLDNSANFAILAGVAWPTSSTRCGLVDGSLLRLTRQGSSLTSGHFDHSRKGGPQLGVLTPQRKGAFPSWHGHSGSVLSRVDCRQGVTTLSQTSTTLRLRYRQYHLPVQPQSISELSHDIKRTPAAARRNSRTGTWKSFELLKKKTKKKTSSSSVLL